MFLLINPRYLFAIVVVLIGGFQSRSSVVIPKYLAFVTCSRTHMCISHVVSFNSFVDLWIIISLYFKALKFTPYLSAYFCNSFRSFWKYILSCTDLKAVYSRQSSANSLKCDETDFERSFILYFYYKIFKFNFTEKGLSINFEIYKQI